MANFPPRLRHGTGEDLVIDATRLLLAFREPINPADVTPRLREFGLVLEDAGDDGKAAIPARVNHTNTRVWTRTADGSRLDDERVANIERGFGDNLAWVGPVYRVASKQDRESLLCPLPNVLVVRESEALEGGRRGVQMMTRPSAAAGREAKITEDREKSRYLPGFRYFVIENPADTNAYEIRAQLQDSDAGRALDIRFESMPLTVPTAAIPNDTLWAQQWDMVRIEAPAGWDITTGVAGVVVCVLDEGCDLGHPDLVFSANGINLGTMSGDGSPTGNHGTACAGIVAATFNNGQGVAGVAGNCRILPVAFQNWTDVEVAAGIAFAQVSGAEVISMSFGWNAWDPAIIDPAILAAFNANVVMCVATHNQNGAITYPATNPRVIACGASDQADNRKNPMSPDGENWGSNFGPAISVVAPGVLIPTTDRTGADGYEPGDYRDDFNGTSSATPHVAGLAGLVLSAYPGLTFPQVRSIIERTAERVGTVAYAETAGYLSGPWNQEMGYGRINVRRALDQADVMIRDFPSDTGAEPSTTGGNFWDFSDVVVRITDDNVFVPSDPQQSRSLEIGQTNYLYVRVRNNGPREARNVVAGARLTTFAGSQFVYPHDWTATDATHIAPTPINATFASIPAGSEVIAKFSISSAQVDVLKNNNWHPCVVVSVTADNDYAFSTAAFSGIHVTRRNNLAQRNLSLINVLADAPATFAFIAGHRLNLDRYLELAINRSRLPKAMPLLLAIDDEREFFPAVDWQEIPGIETGGKGDDGYGCSSLVFLDQTRIRTKFGCCEGVLTLARGSRFDCPPSRRAGDVTVKGGEVILRGGKRFVDIRDAEAVVRIERAPGQVLQLVLESQIPGNSLAGSAFPISVAQRDDRGQVVGGVSVIFATK